MFRETILRNSWQVLCEPVTEVVPLKASTTSKLLSDHGSVAGEAADAIRGVGETLTELAQRLDGILNPTARRA